MSGGPPHHPHSRQAPATNTAWNHLQVPNYFPSRQPQHAHMSNEHPLLHQSTWHTPTTEPSMKALSHSHLFNLEQMLTERQYSRPPPGVDLTLTRNGNSQNGELPTTPISLSVRDTNKINSLPPSALDIQAVELTKSQSPGLNKSVSPGLKPMSPGLKAASPGLATSSEKQNSPKSVKRSNKRMDSILERLNPMLEKTVDVQDVAAVIPVHDRTEPASEKNVDKTSAEKPHQIQSVIVQATSSSHDENSNSSSILNVPTPTNTKEEDVVSPYSNEDSLDSNKSRRKRKPSKTVRVSKDGDKHQEEADPLILPSEFPAVAPENPEIAATVITEPPSIEMKLDKKIPERRRSSGEISASSPRKTRRKTSSESETIANIAAMVHETFEKKVEEPSAKPVTVSVIIRDNSKDVSRDKNENPIEIKENSNAHSTTTLITPAQRKATNFVEVENKLEEMFAGIEENATDPLSTTETSEETKREFVSDSKNNDSDIKLDFTVPSTSQNQDNVTSTSSELTTPNKNQKKIVQRPKRKALKSHDSSTELTPKKKKANKKSKMKNKSTPKKSNKKSVNGKQIIHKMDVIKDIYAYDSGSNTSSTKSRGPFVQIKGPRDSPLAVNIINTPVNDDEIDKKNNKPKKFHDDSEYRYKVRSKGLHCSTLSNKYDAQTRDVNWICVFCKRGPHATEPNTTGPSIFNSLIPPPGDLFGPYLIGTQTAEYERRHDDPYDKQFISKKQNRALEAVNLSKVTGKKSKRKHLDSDRVDESDIYLGITETGEKNFEIWVHEDCVVWSPGVYIIGPKIIGLEEAVWTSCNVNCIKCNFKGANICCLRRGCTNVMHFGCAKVSDWQLDNENCKAYCNLHKKV